jgi:WD40 repeat protein/tRNA A-37 threonylcarbamoyl transferase component Bud32
MTPQDNREDWIVRQARERPPAGRADFLDGACGGDVALRQRVEALLAAQTEGGGFPGPTVTDSHEQGLRAEVPAEEGPGTVIGRYRLLEKIGEGGFGAVYAAEQKEPVKRRVALKIIKLGMDTRQVVARFESERQALALMDHPNIAKVLDAGATDTGRPYFVMELVRGVRITDYCDQNHLSAEARLKLFVPVCHAVQHAHHKGVIHRDIKPSNILMMLADDVAVPKLIDFGIAKATGGRLTDATVYTQLQQHIGTPAYMSPEQAGISGLDVDTRSDIYALGVVLYELLTGRTPFEPKDLAQAGLEEILRRIREEEPPKPSTRLSRLEQNEQTTTAQRRATEAPKLIGLLRGDLDWIVMKCLEKDRRRRYETANGLAQDIERHLGHEPVLARPPSEVYRVRKFVQRNQVMVAAASAVAAAVVLGAVVSTWEAIRATKAGRREAEAAHLADNEKARAEKGEQRAKASELVARQEAYAADMSLAQHGLAMNDLGRAKRLLESHRPRPGEPDLRDWEWRYLWLQCQNDALGELCRYSNSVWRVAYAPPDGQKLAVGGYYQGQFIDIWDVPGRRRLGTLQTNAGHLVAFSPAGDLLATDGTQGTINIWRSSTTNLVHQLAFPGVAKALRFSPDGTRLAGLGQGGQVAVWEVNRWTIVREFSGPAGHWEDDGALDFSPDGETLVVGQDDGKLWFVDLEAGRTNLNFIAHSEMVTAVAWSPKVPVLASGSGYASGVIRLWDTRSGQSIGTLDGHTALISQLIFSADGRRLYSTSGDQTIRIWDVQEKRCLVVLRGSNDEVYGLALSPDGATLASGGKDGAIAFWSTLLQSKEEQPKVLSMQGSQPAFCPSGRVIAIPRAGVVHLYELPGLREMELLSALGTNVVSLAYSPDGKLLASGTADGWLRVWSCGERRLLQEWPAHKRSAWHLRFLSDGRRLVSGSYSMEYRGGELMFWDTVTWQRPSTLVMTNAFLLDVSPDGHLALAGDDVGRLSWWDAASGKLLASAPGHRRRVTGAAFSPDGTRAASDAEDGTVVLWNASSFQAITTFNREMLATFGLTFSPDSRRLATGGTAHDSVKLWDLSTHREVLALSGEGSVFGHVSFSPDGNWLAARNNQGQLHLWRAPSWEDIAAAEKTTERKNR